MNHSNSILELNSQSCNQLVPQGNREPEHIDSNEVEQYMRHAARVLYDIIQDWLKEQPAYKRHKKRRDLPRAIEKVERRSV